MLLRTAPPAGNVLEIWILGLRTIVLGGGGAPRNLCFLSLPGDSDVHSSSRSLH